MAVPANDQLSLIGIFDELNVDDYNDRNSDGETNISLKECSEGDVSTINLGNLVANRPNGSAPHGMTEFYAYDNDLGATIFAYPVSDPERYGVVDFDGNRQVLSIEENPNKPKSKYAITPVSFKKD